MQNINLLAWIYWNPPRDAFTIPLLDRPIAWYGILFVLGFILGYFLIIPLLSRLLYQAKTLSTLDIINWTSFIECLQKGDSSHPLAAQLLSKLDASLKVQIKTIDPQLPLDDALKQGLLKALNDLLRHQQIQREDLEKNFPHFIAPVSQISFFLTDRLCWFLVLGTVIGARLGEVIFYEWSYYQNHPFEIFKIWKGGLASHGGTTGIAIALYLYVLYVRKWVPSLSFLNLLDCLSIPIALGACFIRLGNLVNQEILGTPTLLPWGVIFGNPADGSPAIPRHPVQLYEALAYLSIFFILCLLSKRGDARLRTGMLSGLLLILIFSIRFILEFWKITPQSIFHLPYIQVGQILSLPFIGIGLLFFFSHKNLHKVSISIHK